jgi:hypothetical protein
MAVTLPPTSAGPTDAEFACCVDTIVNAGADWLSEEGRELARSEPILNCCRALIVAVDVDRQRYGPANRAHSPCCNTDVLPRTEIYQHSLCTPWGPPMPPALDWQAA